MFSRVPASFTALLVAVYCCALISANPLQSGRFMFDHLFWQTDGLESSDETTDYVNDNPVIEVDDRGTPVCPPVVPHPGICSAKTCLSDIDCLGTKEDRVCCYNGCVRTCMIKVKPPPFFDWDDTLASSQPDVTNGKIPQGSPTEVAEFQRPAIVLSLPGGCHLTQEQYDSYQKFQTSPNIRQCYCLAGDVFCQIKPIDSAISPPSS